MSAGGEHYRMTTDNILALNNSGPHLAGGPYSVVQRDLIERWAIVAVLWENLNKEIEPRLGVRWFWGNTGFPDSGYWMILPDPVIPGVLASLPLEKNYRHQINHFLSGALSGTELPKEGAVPR